VAERVADRDKVALGVADKVLDKVLDKDALGTAKVANSAAEEDEECDNNINNGFDSFRRLYEKVGAIGYAN
jgi:hypothetical protein